MTVRITADSPCDLGRELIERNNIGITPLHINMGERSLRDGVDCSPRDIFAYTESTGTLCSTSATAIGEYTDFFTQTLEQCDAIVHLSLSSGISSSHQNALVAAGDFPGRVFVVDTLSLTTGMGLLVLEAAEMARSGMAAGEIARAVLARREKVSVSFVPETLEYLRMGGRCSALAAMGANLLKLHPCIEAENGLLFPAKKYRGTMARTLSAYVADRLADAGSIDPARAIVTHVIDDGALLGGVVKQVEDSGVFREVLVAQAGATIACHSGPGVLGLIYMKK